MRSAVSGWAGASGSKPPRTQIGSTFLCFRLMRSRASSGATRGGQVVRRVSGAARPELKGCLRALVKIAPPRPGTFDTGVKDALFGSESGKFCREPAAALASRPAFPHVCDGCLAVPTSWTLPVESARGGKVPSPDRAPTVIATDARAARRGSRVGFDSSQARHHPQPRTRLLLFSVMLILLAQAKNAKRLALNSRRDLLISRMIHGASAADRAGVRAVRDARRARCGSPSKEGASLPSAPVP